MASRRWCRRSGGQQRGAGDSVDNAAVDNAAVDNAAVDNAAVDNPVHAARESFETGERRNASGPSLSPGWWGAVTALP
ncbi:MAG: hypothetical protein ACTHMZ_12440 [Actinomycetes bacterium]